MYTYFLALYRENPNAQHHRKPTDEEIQGFEKLTKKSKVSGKQSCNNMGRNSDREQKD